ncbi:hypothetical protein BHE74_00024999 [Ensete ventricosum]|nr:hypothetical protein BHE74_00024999 [Ensete ventricosum]
MKARFFVSFCIVRYERYVPVQQYIDTRTARYHRNRPSMVDFGHQQSILTVGGRLREKKKRENRGRYLLFPGSPRNPSPAGDSSPVGFLLLMRGDEARKEKGTRRENEATPRLLTWGEGKTRRHLVSLLFTNCDWFAFEDESALETLDRMDDINLNETSGGGNSSDDEVVVGVEEPTKIVLPEDKCTVSDSDFNANNTCTADESLNELSTDVMKLNVADVNPFQFEIAENVDLFNDQQQPEWVGWREASDIQVDEPTDFSTQLNSRETAASTSVSTIGVLAGGSASTVSEYGESAKVDETAHCSFEEDAEFVGAADIEVGRAMEEEVTAPKINFLLKVPDLLEPRDDETAILEFNKSHWRMEPEVGVVQE